MRALLVLSLELPGPASIVDTVEALAKAQLPHSAGELRVVMDPHAAQLLTWLDAE